jgi:hypothetical protein
MTKPEGVLEVHPAIAHLFPPMRPKEFAALKADIERGGVREKIKLLDGKIVDGWNRSRACRELGVRCPSETLPSGTDPVAFALSANATRRQLTKSQLACVAWMLMKSKSAALHPGDSATKAAKLVGCSRRYVLYAKRLYEIDEKVFEEVRSGKLTIPQAKQSGVMGLVLDEEYDLERARYQDKVNERMARDSWAFDAKERARSRPPGMPPPNHLLVGAGNRKHIEIRCSIAEHNKLKSALASLERVNKMDPAWLIELTGALELMIKSWKKGRGLPIEFKIVKAAKPAPSRG